MLIDIDHFKEINDTLGHEIGDALLKEAANRILVCLRDYDTAARMGGDEFSVILSEVVNFADIQRIAQCIIDSLSREFVVMGRTIFASASAGLAVCPDDAIDSSDPHQICRSSPISGKMRRSAPVQLLHQEHAGGIAEKVKARIALRSQEKSTCCLDTSRLSTCRRAESKKNLLRWKTQSTDSFPGRVHPDSRGAGIIHEIGDWVFEQAVAEAKRCCAITGSKFQISVNKSPVQFQAKSDYDLWLDRIKKMEDLLTL